MKTLLIGSSGFIGNHLCNQFREDGIEYIEVCRRNGYDLSDETWIKNLQNHLEIGTVIFLAQSKNYRKFPEFAEDIFSVNIHSLFQTLEWARTNNVKKFIYLSSGSVYQSQDFRYRESSKLHPNNFYSASKISAESMVQSYSDFYNVIILRIFTPYGPQQSNMLIPNIYYNIKNNKPIYLAQGIGLKLSVIFITDLTQIITRISQTDSLPNSAIINVASPNDTTLSFIVKRFSKLLGLEPNIIETDNEPNMVCANTDYLRSLDLLSSYTNISNGLSLFHESCQQ